MARFIRICPHCYESTGDTYQFETTPPVGVTCEDCGSRLQPYEPEPFEREGWLGDRNYSEGFDAEAY